MIKKNKFFYNKQTKLEKFIEYVYNKQKPKNELENLNDKETFIKRLVKKRRERIAFFKKKYYRAKKGRRFHLEKFRKIFKSLSKKIKYNINIRITPNNIFCILKDKNKTILLISAGILHLKISKKKLKFVNKILIQNFIDKIKKKLNQKTCIVKISGPKKMIKFISKKLIHSLIKTKLLMNFLNKKIFNGCRAKKTRKKKRKGLRIFK